MDIPEIRDRLDDRFALLSGGKRRSRQRQQTLEATVQWSFDLLGPQEQQLLCALAVFQGGFDVDDVAHVADVTTRDAIDLVDSLIAKSLIDISRDHNGVLRHRLLETIRIYAIARLIAQGDAVETRDRHLERFLADPAVDWAEYSTMAGQHRVFNELDNFRAAASWALERDRPDATVRIACVLYEGLSLRGEHDLVLNWLQLPATLIPADRITALVIAGMVLRDRLDFESADRAALEAIAVADGTPYQSLPEAYLLRSSLGPMGDSTHPPEESVSLLEQALAIAPDTPSPSTALAVCYLYRLLGRVAMLNFDGAIDDVDALVRVNPDYAWRGLGEAMQACALHFAGRDELARQAVERFSPPSVPTAYTYFYDIAAAIVASRQIGPDQAARRLAAPAYEWVERQPTGIGEWLKAFAVLAVEADDPRRALELASTMTGGSAGTFLGWIATQVFTNWPDDDVDQQVARMLERVDPTRGVTQAALDDRARLFAEEIERWS